MVIFLENIKNSVDFFLRNNFAFSRSGYMEKNENKVELFSKESEIEREKYLIKQYGLEKLRSFSTISTYLENLNLVDILDLYLEITPKQETISILDIGCKNWSYAYGENIFLKKHFPDMILNGIEIDPNRLYRNLYSRKEVAKYHIKTLENTFYIENNLLNHTLKYDYIIWILPFVTKYSHLRWGLPANHFKPEEMLYHAHSLLKPKAQMFIVNQGKEEYEIQQQLCSKLKLPHKKLGELNSSFKIYRHKRFGLIVSK